MNARADPAADHGRRLATGEPRRRRLPLRPQRKVVLSRRVYELDRGDALAVSASIRSDVRQFGYNALVGAQLIVARSPGATPPAPGAALRLARG